MRAEEIDNIARVAVEEIENELTSSFIGVAKEAYQLGVNAGLANRLQDGTFEWALQQMRQGRRVARPGFATLWLNCGSLKASLGGGLDLTSVATEGILATNWEVVPEPKGHGHDWVAEQIKAGRRVRRKHWAPGAYICNVDDVSTLRDWGANDWVLA